MVIRFFGGQNSRIDIIKRKEVTYMLKKCLLPFIISIVLIFAVKTINPKVDTMGILLIVMIGVGIGSLFNRIIFKDKNDKIDN